MIKTNTIGFQFHKTLEKSHFDILTQPPSLQNKRNNISL